MWQDIPFKMCIILSAFIHIAILCPWPFCRLIPKQEISFRKIELAYFRTGHIKDVLIKDTSAATSIDKEDGKENAKTIELEKIKIDLEENSELKVDQKRDVAKDAVSETYKTSQNEKIDNLNTASGDRITHENYCLRVREKIKSILEKNARHFMREGNIYVKFIIKKDGTLKNLTLCKSSHKNIRPLEEIAIESIKEASPFPSFHDGMKEEELPFNLPIRFTLHP
jgi:TonB family protein